MDFGTTNTVLARPGSDGTARPVGFNFDQQSVEALRSALCFWQAGREHELRLEAGPYAIRQFIEHSGECRFIQSFKTFAASHHFQGTLVYGKRYRFEDLLDAFLSRIRAYADGGLDALPRRIVVGRPVEFAGPQPDAALATERYETALRRFGFSEILYVYEPVAAAFFFARALTRPATVLVADFGGGTTDFSIMRFERRDGVLDATPLGHGGIGIAGDQFDYRIVDQVILPRLGKGSRYKHMGKVLDVPRSFFSSFARWNLLSVLKTTAEFRDIKRVARWSLEPDKITRLIDLVEEDQGYPLYKAVSEAKARLSSSESTELVFAPLGQDGPIHIKRRDFETWIAADLAKIESALEHTLTSCGLAATAIDRVFLTGGTSFIPAVRRLFERRFGIDRIESGNELVSIANGLALIGQREDAARWAVHPSPPRSEDRESGAVARV
jgi:hypothetical chaperone protein